MAVSSSPCGLESVWAPAAGAGPPQAGSGVGAGGSDACVPQRPTQISLLPLGSQSFMEEGGICSHLSGHRWSLVPRLPGAHPTSARNAGVLPAYPGFPGRPGQEAMPGALPKPCVPKAEKASCVPAVVIGSSGPAWGRAWDTAHGKPQRGSGRLPRNAGLCRAGENRVQIPDLPLSACH